MRWCFKANRSSGRGATSQNSPLFYKQEIRQTCDSQLCVGKLPLLLTKNRPISWFAPTEQWSNFQLENTGEKSRLEMRIKKKENRKTCVMSLDVLNISDFTGITTSLFLSLRAVCRLTTPAQHMPSWPTAHVAGARVHGHMPALPHLCILCRVWGGEGRWGDVVTLSSRRALRGRGGEGEADGAGQGSKTWAGGKFKLVPWEGKRRAAHCGLKSRNNCDLD